MAPGRLGSFRRPIHDSLPSLYMAINTEGFGAAVERDFDPDSDVLIRQSTINSMALSPCRVGYKGEEGYDFSPSRPLLLGSTVHDLLEQALLGEDVIALLQEDVILLSVNEALAEFETEESLLDIAGSDEAIESFVSDVRNALASWQTDFWKDERDRIDIITVEAKLQIPLGELPDGRAVFVQGTPDLLAQRYDGPVLYDWKTSTRGWKPEKAGTRIQAPVYAWLVEQEYDLQVGEFDFLVYNVRKSEWTRYPVAINDEYVEATMRNAWQWARMIAYEVFPCTSISSVTSKPGWWVNSFYNPAYNACSMGCQVYGKDNYDARKAKDWR